MPCEDGDGHPPGSWDLQWPDANGRWHRKTIGPDERCQYPGVDFTDHGDPEIYLEAYLRQREQPGGYRDAELDVICRAWGWGTIAEMEHSKAQEALWKNKPVVDVSGNVLYRPGGRLVSPEAKLELVDNPRDRGTVVDRRVRHV